MTEIKIPSHFSEVSDEDFEDIVDKSKGSVSPFLAHALTIGVGKTIFIKKEEWITKYGYREDTSATPRQSLINHPFIVTTVEWKRQKGWTIKRITKEEKERLNKAKDDE